LHNPVSFYKQKILKIKEFDDVEETVAFNTLGTVVHETLDELYTPFVGKFLTVEAILAMQEQAKDLVAKHFKIHFKNGNLTTGKNRLIFEVANRFVTNFLKKEKALCLIFEVANRFVTNFLKKEKALLQHKNNQLKIIATEENLSTEIKINGLEYPVKLHGQVDRVDELNGVLRIIDYKTGMVTSSNLRVPEFENLRDEKHLKAIQVLLYAYLYTQSKNYNFNQPLEAGIYSFKNLNSGFLSVDFALPRRKAETNITSEKLEDFITEIKSYISEIYNLEIDFIEPADLRY